MKKAIVAGLLSVVMALSCLTACQPQQEGNLNQEQTNGQVQNPKPEKKPEQKPDPEPEKPAKSTVLAEPSAFEGLTWEERNSEKVAQILESANAFAYKFTQAVYDDYDKEDNFTISPISVYMAMALAAECAEGTTREEILNALGVTYEQLSSDFELLYRYLNATYYDDNHELAGMVDLSNSVWLDEAYTVNQPALSALAEKYFCGSRKVDFFNENENANLAIRQFVREKTRGLIDQDFQLGVDTAFALINTLYLKDVWNVIGDDLSFTDKEYTFHGSVGDEILKFLQGYYTYGRAYEAETFTHFYTTTEHGYKLKFILPKAGHTVREVFTAENMELVNTIKDYRAFDDNAEYHTRCLFPEFEAKYDENVNGILGSNFGINQLFDENFCDFSGLVDLTRLPRGVSNVYCSMVKHVAKLKVDKTGIEGAAVTIVCVEGADSAPNESERVYLDYIVDGSFGFILTDRNDNVLFTGVVENV